MKVTFSDPMKAQLPEFSDEIRQAVLNFVAHVKEHGLIGLQGRNKSSVPDNVHTKKERVNYTYAQKHCFGITISVFLAILAKMAIGPANIFCITKDLMMGL